MAKVNEDGGRVETRREGGKVLIAIVPPRESAPSKTVVIDRDEADSLAEEIREHVSRIDEGA